MRNNSKLTSTEKAKEKAFLVGYSFRKATNFKEELLELKRLAESANLEVVGQDAQVVKDITPGTLLGTGKVEEIAEKVDALKADVVIVDANLTGSQARNLSDIFGVKVIDRILTFLRFVQSVPRVNFKLNLRSLSTQFHAFQACRILMDVLVVELECVAQAKQNLNSTEEVLIGV